MTFGWAPTLGDPIPSAIVAAALAMSIPEARLQWFEMEEARAIALRALDDRWWYGTDWQILGPTDRARKAARAEWLFGVAS